MTRDLAAEAIIEHEIAVAAEMMRAATTKRERTRAFNRLKHWHYKRSPEKIAELEREKGLRP